MKAEGVVAKERKMADSLLLDAMHVWDEAISEAQVSFADLGFEAWEKIVEEESLDEIAQESSEEKTDENVEAEDENQEEKDATVEEQAENDATAEAVDEEQAAENVTAETVDEEQEAENVTAETVDEEQEAEEAIVETEDENSGEEVVADGADQEEVTETADEEITVDESDEEITDTEDVSEEAMDSAMPVIYDVDRLELNYYYLDLIPGEQVQLRAKFYPENANVTVTWSVDSFYSPFLSVDANGLVTAKKAIPSETAIMVTAQAGTKTAQTAVYFTDVTASVEATDEDGNDTSKYVSGTKVLVKDGIWVGNFEKSMDYTGKAVTQDLHVYYKGERLTLNKDYSLSYKNNVNACSGDLTNSPSVTVTMKGQYSGKKTLYYAIKARDINLADNTTNNISLPYNGKVQKYVPTIVYQGKKLVNNKDFTITYSTSEPKTGKIDYTVTGKGNFTSVDYGTYYIVDKGISLNKASVTMKTAYSYTGGTPVDTDVATALDIKVKFAGDTTVYTPVSDTANFSYEISYPAGFIGNATITIRSNTSGGFRGVINKSFKMVPAYKLATVARVNEYFADEVQYYKETSWNEQEYSVGLEKIAAPHTPLIRDVDYKVSYSGINKVGTATVTYTGIGAYTGVIKKTYKIVNKAPVLIAVPSDVEYTQGGVFNAVGAVYCSTVDKGLSPVEELLTPNVDYTVTYTNNKAPGVAGYTVKGKGSYANATPVSGSFTIKTADITKCAITVPDKAYSSKKGAFKSVPVITAPNGKKLVAGKDYDKNIEYFYDDWDDVNSPYYNCPPAGSVVNVKVTGIGAYAGKYITGCYCVYDSKNNGMKKLCIAIDDKVYTGKPVELDVDKDIHVYLSAADMKAKKNEQKPASNYVRIISYKNNIASGKATVTLGNSFSKTATIYGGTKNVTYKILKKNYELPKAVTGITLDYSTFTLNSVTYMDYGTIKATITPADATNKNIQWKTSNPAIVDISYSGAICNISAKGAGTCVISAITQDGAKVAKCTVTSNYKPLQSITLPEKKEVYMGSSINLSYTRVPADGYIGSAVATWTVEDSSIATVNSAGKVTGVTPGETYVTCSIAGKSAKCKIVVDGPKPIDRIKLSSELITLKVNDTKTLTCTIEPSDAHTTTYAWSSSNTSVATVDSTGKVKAVAVGEAVISVKNYNMTATCIVKVRQNAYPLAFNVTKEEDYNDLPIGRGAGPAKPNDGTNDANSIRWAFTALRNTSIGYNAVYIPSGVYDLTCSEYGGLDITGMKNVTLYMDPDTVLKINGSNAGIVGVSISNCQNFTIVGGIIEGNISDISFDGGKSGSCSAVTVINSKGVTLDGVTIRNSVGDGISLLGNENVTIKNCLITKCKDSGVSLDRNEAAGSINITNSIISDIGGYSYGGYGISCGVNEYNIKNIYVKSCSFYNNSKDDFFTPKAGTGVKSVISDITFDGCSFSGAVDIGSGTNIKFINTVRKPKKYYNAVTKSSVFPG